MDNDDKFESLEKYVDAFEHIKLPPRGIVDTLYKNWKTIIKNMGTDEETYKYVTGNSYPSYMKKQKNGVSVLVIAVKNSVLSSFFKTNENLLINNINILFKKVIISKIKVEMY